MCSSVPPRYQGVRGLTLTTLSPSSALIGMKWTFARFKVLREFAEIRTDFGEYFLAVVNEVHFIHGNDDVRNRKQRRDERMPARLRQNTLCARPPARWQAARSTRPSPCSACTARARRVGNDELALRRGEIPVRDIDRDSLLAFGFKPSVSSEKSIGPAERFTDAFFTDAS